MSATTPTTKQLRLEKPADWPIWLSFVRIRAQSDDVWDLVNPNQETRSSHLIKPSAPSEPEVDATGNIDLQKFEQYKAQLVLYKARLAKYNAQNEAFNRLILHIQSTISATTAIYLENVEAHPYNLLRALKLRLAPTDESRKIRIEAKYHELCKGPSNQDVEKFLDSWQQTYVEGKELGVSETTGSRPIRDFIYSLMDKDEAWANAHLAVISMEVTDESFFNLISEFRNHTRLKQSRKLHHSTHSAFSASNQQGDNQPTNQNSSSNQNFSSSRGGYGRGGALFRGRRQPRECLCGVIHWFGECLYLNPARRPLNWKGDSETAKRVSEGMKNEDTRKKVEISIQRIEDMKKNSQQNSQQPSGTFVANQANNQTHWGAFTTANSASSSYPLRSSWILDGGSDIHVCNQTMLHRFRKTGDAPAGGVIAGEAKSNVEAYGEVDITLSGPDGEKRKITLTGVCYIPNFMTNLVASIRLRRKGVFFDDMRMRLHAGGKTFAWVKHLYDHDVLEDNITCDESASQKKEEEEEISAFSASGVPIKVATVNDWHQLLAHANDEVIQHLESAAEGVSVSDRKSANVPKTNECETCALSKMHRIVSRSPSKEENSDLPFFRVSYDLMAMTRALNGHEWVSHLACMSHDFNIVYTHKSKGEAQEIVRQDINLIRTRFKGKVVFFRSDGEKSLGNDFRNFIADMGMTYESSAPDTPAQNGHSEKKGHLLAMKARALRIGAGLPVYLWPWIIQTTGYLMNRTPMKKHGWKTPHESILKKKPHLGHLRKFGCKAYSLDKDIPKKEKLAPRAHIGHLVGYDSTNIFLIWLPSQRKVIRTRDVMFDENSIYQKDDVDLMQLIEEPMLDTAFDVSILPTSAVIEELESDEEIEAVGEANAESIEGIESTGQSKEKEKESHAADDRYLPSPSPTPTASENSGSTSPMLTPGEEENSENSASEIPENSEISPPPAETSGGAEARPPAPRRKFHPTPTAPRDISSRVDESNVIPEGVKRTRIRKQAYVAAIDRAADGGDEAFHGAFNAHLDANQYYNQKNSSDRPFGVIKFHRDSMAPEPQHYGDLRNHPHAEGFKKAMETELNSLKSKGTWTEVFRESINQHFASIPTTWVFKYKFDDQGYLTKYKARLCARGDLQKTQQDTYAATLAARIFRALMALVNAFDLETRQYDAINAFVNSEIDEDIYLRPPAGWTGQSDVLLLLLKALYGLKQSPALWYRHFFETLNEFGLHQVSGVECLFINDHMLCFFFVDDIAVLYDRSYTHQVDEFQKRLFDRYEMRYIGEIQWFLGIRISRDRYNRVLYLCQDSYIEKLASKFNISIRDGGKGPASPLGDDQVKNSGLATKQEIYAYQQRVGSINYAAVITRPDVAYAASKLSEFLNNPSKTHLTAADRVISYLAHTKHLAIRFDAQVTDPQSIFIASSDASYADDPETRYSSQGYGFKLFNGLVDWKAFKQKTVTTSTTEAELLAISATGKELIWWTRFFEEISFHLPHTSVIQCDNMQTIRVLTNPTSQFTTKLRHVDVHRHWLGQEVRARRITVKWTPTARILADGFTKALAPQKHKEFVRLIGLQANYEDAAKGGGSEAASKMVF